MEGSWQKAFGGSLKHYFYENGVTACGKSNLVARRNPTIAATGGNCKKCEVAFKKAAQHSVQPTGLSRVLEVCPAHDIHFVGSCPLCSPRG